MIHRRTVVQSQGFLALGLRGGVMDDGLFSTMMSMTVRPVISEGLVDVTYGYSDQGSCLLYTSPSPRDLSTSRMPSSA